MVIGSFWLWLRSTTTKAPLSSKWPLIVIAFTCCVCSATHSTGTGYHDWRAWLLGARETGADRWPLLFVCALLAATHKCRSHTFFLFFFKAVSGLLPSCGLIDPLSYTRMGKTKCVGRLRSTESDGCGPTGPNLGRWTGAYHCPKIILQIVLKLSNFTW